MRTFLTALFMTLATQVNALKMSLFLQLDHEAQTFYLGGIAETLLFTSLISDDFNNPKLMCLPEGTTISSEIVRSALTDWHNEPDVEVALAAILSFSKMYPCEK